MKRLFRVQTLINQELIADKCVEAVRYFDRLKGLIGRKAFEPGEAMYFPQCNDIHMWFMSIPIDVVFVDRSAQNGNLQVVSVHENVRPWRALPLRDGRARDTIELPVGTIARHKIREGDQLCLS